MTHGTLFLVGTPIGHADDLSPRAREVLASVDFIICEEWKPARALLRRLGIDRELVQMNEHNETDEAPALVARLAGGARAALISDCGMPVFADPGTTLVPAARAAGVRITAIPGPTSLTTALALCPFPTSRFLYHGFLSQKHDRRRHELLSLRTLPHPVVFLDAPYRLRAVLTDIVAVLGPEREVCLACDLTSPDEVVFHGTTKAALLWAEQDGRKREYVIIVREGRRG